MSKPGQTGLRRIWNAVFYSLQGVTAAWRHEAAFRQEAALCIVMIPLAFLLGSGAVERALLAGSCLLVLVTELLNSAIETRSTALAASIMNSPAAPRTSVPQLSFSACAQQRSSGR